MLVWFWAMKDNMDSELSQPNRIAALEFARNVWWQAVLVEPGAIRAAQILQKVCVPGDKDCSV